MRPTSQTGGAGRAHAAIDVGTNSIHLLVARAAEAGDGWDVLAQEKEVVRLGHGGGDMTHLDDDAMDRGIAALKRFRQIAEIWDADITAVATSAVREATNHAEFTDRARREADVAVEIISGVEEARLIRVGVLHALPVYDQRLLVIDIGGGSTEVVIGERDEVIDVRSMKLGAIRLTDRFFTGEGSHEVEVEACRRYVHAFVEPIARALAVTGFEAAAGSSGTIETIAAIALARRGEAPDRSLNNMAFGRDELEGAIAAVTAEPDPDARARMAGSDPRRADIIVAGAIVLEQLLAALEVDELRISTYALREGVLFDKLRHTGAPLDHLSDLRRRSVLRLASQLDPDRAHSERLTRLALEIFDGTRSLHGLGYRHRELLEAAGLLHNVGLFISHSAHHKHSYYVIRNSEHMLGFTDHEIELIALVARYHRKSHPREKHPELLGITPEDRSTLAVLAGILRVAIGLDRAHAPTVAEVAVSLSRSHGPGPTLLRIEPRCEAGADASLELYSADQRKHLLAEALGVEIEIGAPQNR